MYTPDPDFPAKPHHFMSKRLGISISLVLFVLVLLLSYALCSLQVDRSTQAILADKNRFLLSKIDTMQIRLQDWRRTMLEQTNTLALSESVRLFASDMAALPSDLLDKSSRTAAPGSDSDQLSLLDQREYMQQLLADIAYQNDLDRIRMFLPNGRKIVDSASDAADNHDDDLLVRQAVTVCVTECTFREIGKDEYIDIGGILELAGIYQQGALPSIKIPVALSFVRCRRAGGTEVVPAIMVEEEHMEIVYLHLLRCLVRGPGIYDMPSHAYRRDGKRHHPGLHAALLRLH